MFPVLAGQAYNAQPTRVADPRLVYCCTTVCNAGPTLNLQRLNVPCFLSGWLLSQQTQNICITFIQRRPNVFDVGPTLYKCHTNVLCLLGCGLFVGCLPIVASPAWCQHCAAILLNDKYKINVGIGSFQTALLWCVTTRGPQCLPLPSFTLPPPLFPQLRTPRVSGPGKW